MDIIDFTKRVFELHNLEKCYSILDVLVVFTKKKD